MPDTLDWLKTLPDYLKKELRGNLEWRVVNAKISIVTAAPDGQISIDNFNYTGQGHARNKHV